MTLKRTLGVCYYPEHWPEAQWAEDAARMAALGLTWVRIGEFAWNRMEPTPGRMEWAWLDRAIPQIGSMISRLVRVEDTPARLAPEVFALALPATPQAAARAAGERIAAVIGCTAFEAGEGKPPFVVEFDIGVAEVSPIEGVGRALEQAAERAQAG